MKKITQKYLREISNTNNVTYLQSTTSTFDVARELIEGEISTPHLIVAKRQTCGRGRKDRTFSSSIGGIYLSVILDSIDINSLSLVTPAAAVAVVRAIKKTTQIQTQIKWVNDLFLNNKKICGILTENAINSNGTNYIIVGIGINFITPKNNFPLELRDKATALFDIEPKNLRLELIKEVFLEVSNLCNNPKNILPEYKNDCFILNKTIILEDNSEAVAIDIDDEGGLVIDIKGELKTLKIGEVSIKHKI